MKKGKIGYLAFVTSVLLMVGFLLIQASLSKRSNGLDNPSEFIRMDVGDGWTKYENTDGLRFSISFPNNWNVMKNSTGIEGTMKESKGLGVAEITWGDSLSDNTDLTGYVQTQIDALKKQLHLSMVQIVSESDSEVIIKYRNDLTSPTGNVLYNQVTQYYLLRNDSVLVITLGLGSEPSNFENFDRSHSATIDRIRQSFEWS